MIYTLMHDPVYRLAVARQNTAYNQPPHLGYYLGEDNKDQVLAMELPTYAMHYTNAPIEVSASADKEAYTPNETITVNVTTDKNVKKAYPVSYTHLCSGGDDGNRHHWCSERSPWGFLARAADGISGQRSGHHAEGGRHLYELALLGNRSG